MASSSAAAAASVRQRPAATAALGQQQQPPILQDDDQQALLLPNHQDSSGGSPLPPSHPPQTSSSALASAANLLPTGTLLAFNLLAPTFTNHGVCDGTTSLLTRGLLVILAVASALACFTDSVKSPHDGGRIYYGVATRTGLWLIDYPSDAPPIPTSTTRKYRIAFLDFVHAAVFGVVAARDRGVVACLCGPQPDRATQELLDVLPLGVGVLSSSPFPTRRHGIGYPLVVTTSSSSSLIN